MRLIDADELIKDRVSNDPVVIAVKCAETVDPESVRQHGKWKDLSDEVLSGKCSACGCISFKDFNFFPLCGAKMDRKEDTESAENKTTSFLINRFLKVN